MSVNGFFECPHVCACFVSMSCGIFILLPVKIEKFDPLCVCSQGMIILCRYTVNCLHCNFSHGIILYYSLVHIPLKEYVGDLTLGRLSEFKLTMHIIITLSSKHHHLNPMLHFQNYFKLLCLRIISQGVRSMLAKAATST